MFLIIILSIFIIYSLFFKNSESFNNLNNSNLNSIIVNKVSESEFDSISTNDIYLFFQNIYSSYNNYESGMILLNDTNLFKRFFILDKNELVNGLSKLNNILKSYQNYNIIDESTQNSNFWDITIFGENNFKDNINNIIDNTDLLSDKINRRQLLMSNDNLRILFKSIFDEIGMINFNS